MMKILFTILFLFFLGTVYSQNVIMINKYVRLNGNNLEIDSLRNGGWKVIATQGYAQANGSGGGGVSSHGLLNQLPIDSSGHTGSPFGLWGFDENGESQNILFDVNVQRWDQALDNFRSLTGTGILRQVSNTNYTLGGEIVTAEVGNSQITNAKLSESVGLTLLGRSSESPGVIQYITATAANQVFRISPDGTTLAPGSVNLESDDAVSGTLGFVHLPGGGAIIGNSGDPSEVDSLLWTDGTNIGIKGIRVISSDLSVDITYDTTQTRLIYDLSVTAGGAGTVNTGTQYRIPYYATTGTALSEAAAITAARVLISDVNGVPTHSTITTTTLGYLDATSSIQTQIDAKQATDADLTAIAALSGTNTIYYRSASNTWTAVTVSTGLDFTGGILTATGGGSGDVVGPASATDDALAIYDGTTGELIKNSTYIATTSQFTVPDGVTQVIGHTAPITVTQASTFQVLGTTAADASLLVGRFSTTDADYATITLYKSGNASLAGQTVVANDEAIGRINFAGHQETSAATTNVAVSIAAFIDNTVTSGSGGDMPGRLEFFITPNASGTPVSELLLNSTGLYPSTNGGLVLGSTTAYFGGVYVGSGGSVDFFASDARILHSANLLQFLSATNGYRFDNPISPTANDGTSLGTSALRFSDEYMALGAVIDFNADMTITHSADNLTIAGGTFNTGNLSISLGSKISIATGSNASVGTATLSSGTVTVSTTAVSASSRIFVTGTDCVSCGTTYIGTVTAATSFVINSTNGADGSTVSWFIIN